MFSLIRAIIAPVAPSIVSPLSAGKLTLDFILLAAGGPTLRGGAHANGGNMVESGPAAVGPVLSGDGDHGNTS